MTIINKLETKKVKGKDVRGGVFGVINAPVYWAKVQKPELKYKSEDREYSLTVFVSEEDKDILENDFVLNKQFAQVGKTKRKGKVVYPTSDQVEDGKFNYDDVKGMWGVKFNCPEFNGKGDRLRVEVYGEDGKPTKELVGNGSKANLRIWCYQNEDGQLNTRLNSIRVTELVAYESDGGADGFDDILGVERVKPEVDDILGSDVENDAPFDMEDDEDLY